MSALLRPGLDRGTIMTWYRLYHLGSDGQHVAPEDVEAFDDLAAVRKARTVPNGFGAELWHGRRKIADVPPTVIHRQIGRQVGLFGA
ncbi:hypothetical protein [Sphingomonas sp. CGMCC 1.13658]|nr:hypothetical protein [Sphingomonas sp. CGMCC 1.13658]